MTRTITSIVNGASVDGAPRRHGRAPNPAQLDEVVGEVSLGDAGTFVAAAAGRREGAARPGPTCRRRSAAGRSPTSAGWSRPTPRRWPGW